MPPKVVKNGLIAHKMAPNSASKKTAAATETAGAENGVASEVHNLEDMKSLVEKQNDTIKAQKVEIELLRKQMEKNVHLTQDFQSELSEIRKNWQSLSENKTVPASSTQNCNNTNTSAGEKKTIEDVLLRLEALSSSYTDIQDRLYELDKSWKNNLMIYGVPCCDGEEDDPIITEEKVKEILMKKLHISRDIQMNRVHRLNYGPDFRGHKPIQVCLVNYRDKEEILRKARLLKGSNIYISEDFSRKVREHRNELIKFMKEVKSRDPTRRMTLRYDKLYIGNDVFFFNDRTGRVERLHTPLEVGSNNFSNLMNDNNSQQQQYHDSSWLRRPRSRMGMGGNMSRCATPLSRQNSMSMEDFSTSMPGLQQSSQQPSQNPQQRVTSSARFRRSNPGSPRKSVSIDSLHGHTINNGSSSYYGSHEDMNSQPVSRQNSAQYKPDYTLDSYIPTSSIANGYYVQQEPVRSNPGSPSKRVAFKGIPSNGLPNNYNHPVAPYQNFEVQNPRLDTPMTMNPEEMLAIESEAQPRATYPALTNGINSYPALMNTTSQMVTPYTHTRSVIPAASKALVTPNNHVINGMNPYPQLDYQHHQQQQQQQQHHHQQQQPMVPVSMSNGRYIPDKYGNSLINNPAMAIDNALKKNTAPLPAIMAPNNGAVTPYINNGMDSEDEMDDHKKALELEYKNEENNKRGDELKEKHHNESVNNAPGGNNEATRKNSTSNNGTIKVAMVADISMSNFHQCK